MTFLTHEDPSMQREKAGYRNSHWEHHASLLLVWETMEKIPRAVFLTSCPNNHDLSPYKLAKIAIQASKHIYRSTKGKSDTVYFLPVQRFSGASWGI